MTGTLRRLRISISIPQNLEFRRVANFFNEFKMVFKLREESVAFDFSLHKREKQFRTVRQGLLVNLRTAADEDLVVGHWCRQLLQ